MLVDTVKMLKSEIKILLTGGGSGGHISVSKALIDTLIEDYNIPIENIVYVGGDLGMEGEKIGNSLEQKQFKDSKFKTYFIRAGKLQRKFAFSTLTLLLRSILGFFDSLHILHKENPSIVISTGGFVSVPVCIIGNILGKRIYLHEQTASVGLANKIVSKFAKKIYVSFKESIKYFDSTKTKHVGNILRKEIFRTEYNENTNEEIVQLITNRNKLPLIYISGGSLGSHILNTKVLESLDILLEFYRIILQTGDNEIFKDFDNAQNIKQSFPEGKKARFVVVSYLNKDDIGYVLNNMDIFVGRSGANTVYELGVLKKHALLIPIPWVTHNEQFLNAKVLKDIGLANILEEKYLKESNLKDEIERLREQIRVRKIDIEKLDSLFPRNATTNMLEDIFQDCSN
ncbi:hypothetical protein A2436_00885 [candidate division WS6 bacterium RIFOXYC1_FULL_33_9]|uniref:UDP-N-acetylglucosamine--N-acetylmuramyl-(pentapeptide) pyrophosphoryl-undecaprenol N-acetylglucosamine transferase n=1 Tax=candidate division WS6 bacterium GW2011_GWB1_33_6 TaxID=1619088 RepID=A0A0G0CT09_9BACT|nr:MAG: hypothetical protein UR47_C0022G0002 [candidate division WS6 bacterium GW2011_GWB1_33_6]OGC37231.1 MAG: hypothetical protein A2436_00885 [candidate division WS6 bacterium RIFOXYC1_FULL_33_9]HBB64915.1 hypothetical protein [Patescibacteria group bacterium]